MKDHLVPCPSCQRHIRAHELACPFCTGVLPPAFALTPPPRRAPGGLGRAAMFAFALGGTAACADDPQDGIPTDGGAAQVDLGNPQAAYGAVMVPQPDAAPRRDSSISRPEMGGAVALYGAVPAPSPDGGGGVVAPAYGVVPVPPDRA